MIDEAFARWRAARAAGESIVVMAADHATVDALALRARAERVTAGEVERDGTRVGTQLVGRGDEIVTTRNDRRLVTTAGLWVRNGDRWQVDARHNDGALVVSHLDGHGRVVLPADYAAQQVALAYAVTVHKAEGITVDSAVLLADSATTGEHLYVGMTRGRHDNRVCVVTDAATTGHGYRPPPTPVDVLAAVMHRSSAELSATETLRDELDRGEDREILRRLHEQARAYIDAHAGPERRPELHRLRQVRSTLPTMRNILAVNQRELARLHNDIARIRHRLSDDEAQLANLTRRRRFRRPDHHAIDIIRHRIDAQSQHVEQLQKQRASAAAGLERSRSRLRDAERNVDRIPDIEAAIQRRRDWFRTHPDELAWEADLAARLADSSRSADPRTPEDEHSVSEFDDLLASIDLRTVDLSPTGRRTGIERHVDDALGISHQVDPIERTLRPPPSHGLDGPDVGLGL